MPNELNAAIRDIPLPRRMARLPINEKGFPIPAFVAWLTPDKKSYLAPGASGAIRDFRVVDPFYINGCFRLARCWVCGEPLGRHQIFVISPMCAVSRTTMEPPSHRECAEYSARACPFVSNPRMRRNDKDMPEGYSAPGLMIERNPGAMALWETRDYRRFRAGNGLLCHLGDPERVDWWAQGRAATRAEVLASIDSGYPLLMKEAEKEGAEGVAALEQQRREVERYLPAA